MRESLHLQYYTTLGPGAGFFPFWIAFLLGCLGAVLLYQGTFRPSPATVGGVLPDRRGGLRIAAVLVALCGPILLLDTLGFRLTMLTFMGGMLTVLGYRGVLGTVLIATGGSFGVYHLFVQWLGVPLPPGRFGF
jgi:putative tricarboxylic transport membrane protein